MKFSVILFEIFNCLFGSISFQTFSTYELSIVTPEPRIFETRVDIQLKARVTGSWFIKDLGYIQMAPEPLNIFALLTLEADKPG